MSSTFDKETTSSTARSLVGALIALGSGFLFMFLGLAAVTARSAQAEADLAGRLAVEQLQRDLLENGALPLEAQPDGRVLRLSLPGATPDEVSWVSYRLSEDEQLWRESDQQRRRLGTFPKGRFQVSDRFVRFFWFGSGAQQHATWGRHRWGEGS